MKCASLYVTRLLALICGIAFTSGLYAEDGDGDPQSDLGIFRKNISKSPGLVSNKAKLNIMPVYMPFLDAQGVPQQGDGWDKPLVVTYLDEVEEVPGVFDVYGAVSRDAGNTFKRKNLSRTADNSSFNGYPGTSAKPLLAVAANRILVAWTDKYCKGGRPHYSVDSEADIYGVAGSQRSIDYMAEHDLPLGEVPFSCVWIARGVVVADEDLGKLKDVGALFGRDLEIGDVVWYKPERLTSGRRDAYQLFMNGKAGVGFAIAWQEDPEGLRPGYGDGPGHGFSGATTNHKTDIWYSFIEWDDFLTVEPEALDPDDPDADFTKPRAAVHMSIPVRISDNDVCHIEHAGLTEEPAGNAHAYCAHQCPEYVHVISNGGKEQDVCVTDKVEGEGKRLLDGDTGASRPNLFMQGKWVILAYEETKGLGAGNSHNHDGEEILEVVTAEDTDPEDIGKDIIYHSFKFDSPKTVSGGHILNLPQLDPDTLEPIWIAGDKLVLRDREHQEVGEIDTGRYATENARRIRFILQGASAAASSKSQVPLIAIYKQGMYGKGRPSDVMLRRMVLPASYKNPYDFKHFTCEESLAVPTEFQTCLSGAYNMSSVTPDPVDGITEPTGDEEWAYKDQYDDKIRYQKLSKWSWDSGSDNRSGDLRDESWMTPMIDARAHRGQIRGDFVVMGYTWTPNWAAARNGHAKYDFYIRTSYDGGKTWATTGETWTKKPHESPGIDVLTSTQPRNISLLKNNKFSVVEPRIVATPGSIWKDPDKKTLEKKEDLQNKNVFYWTYGLAEVHVKGHPEHGLNTPTNMYMSRSQDKGQSYDDVMYYEPHSEFTMEGDPDTTRGGYGWKWLANRKYVAESEAQLRMTPDGSRFYSIYLSESGPEVEEDDHFYGSDIWIRKIDHTDKKEAN